VKKEKGKSRRESAMIILIRVLLEEAVILSCK